MAEAGGPFSRFKTLIATDALPALGPQPRPGTVSDAELDRKLADFFAKERLPAAAQTLLRSAAFLWHDHLDASHNISQGIETRDGSWLHGIMHRREPDYGNAKYWFHRVGRHEAFPALARNIGALPSAPAGLVEKGEWKPMAFIDLCERAEQGKDAALTATLQKIQAAEFDALVGHILSNV
jgi:hypothetical protein